MAAGVFAAVMWEHGPLEGLSLTGLGCDTKRRLNASSDCAVEYRLSCERAVVSAHTLPALSTQISRGVAPGPRGRTYISWVSESACDG